MNVVWHHRLRMQLIAAKPFLPSSRIGKFSEKTRRLKSGGSQDWLPHRAADPQPNDWRIEAWRRFGLFHCRRGVHRAQPAVTVGARAGDHAEVFVLQLFGDRAAVALADDDAVDGADGRDLGGSNMKVLVTKSREGGFCPTSRDRG